MVYFIRFTKAKSEQFLVSAEMSLDLPSVGFMQNDLTAQQQAHEMKSVTAAACSRVFGYAVVLFSTIENITEL